MSFKPPGGGGGAPTTATYITQTPDATLSAEQALSTLSTGLMKVTNGTGVISTAAAGTDYLAPNGDGSALTNVLHDVVDDTTPQLGGNLDCQTNDITNIGSIGATGTRITKGWFTDIESTNMPTVGGTAIDSTFSPIAGSASIVTVGTVTTGVWNAGAVTSSGAIQGTTLSASATASLSLGTASTATGQIIFYDASGVNTVTFQPGASAASVTYTWPTNVGAAGAVLTDAAGNGTLSWATPTGNTLDEAYDSGGAGAGRAIDADSGAVTITVSDTDSNACLELTQNDVTNDPETLTLTATTLTSNVFSVTDSSVTSGRLAYFYTNSGSNTATSLVEIHNDNVGKANTSALKVRQDSTGATIEIAASTSNVSGTYGIIYANAPKFSSGCFLCAEGNTGMTSGTFIEMTSTSNAVTSGTMFNFSLTGSGITADKSGALGSLAVSRTLTAAAARSDDYDTLSITRESVANNAGGTLNAAGSVVYISNTGTQTAGTLNDTVIPLEIANNVTVSTNFTVIAKFGSFTLYVSDGTTAEGNLTGVEGDICLNGGTGNGQMAYCDANGTNWTDM